MDTGSLNAVLLAPLTPSHALLAPLTAFQTGLQVSQLSESQQSAILIKNLSLQASPPAPSERSVFWDSFHELSSHLSP